MTRKPLLFGMQTVPTRPYEELVSFWKRYEALGFDSLWLPDHFVPVFKPQNPMLEAWTLLAAMATNTERIRLGVLVSCNTFRHPALVAKQAATIDHISGGRLEFGLGAGWVEFEHDMFGLRYPDNPERVAMYKEAVEVCDLLLRNESTTFAGEFYQLKDAPFRPAPVQQPRPPFTLAAHAPKMIKIIAPYVDRWNSMGTPAEIAERNKRLDDALVDAGRDPNAVIRSLLFVAAITTTEQPWESVDAWEDYIGRYRDAGVNEFIFQIPLDDQIDVFDRVVAEKMPILQRGN
jgi:alkanesulfonate monooxygenase SsuD/methylene tetrahydromethanopterin reductase-like flavin-dependent oxidoreductase (luciferase family)